MTETELVTLLERYWGALLKNIPYAIPRQGIHLCLVEAAGLDWFLVTSQPEPSGLTMWIGALDPTQKTVADRLVLSHTFPPALCRCPLMALFNLEGLGLSIQGQTKPERTIRAWLQRAAVRLERAKREELARALEHTTDTAPSISTPLPRLDTFSVEPH